MTRLLLPVIFFGAVVASSQGGLMAFGDRYCEDIAKIGTIIWWANWETDDHCPDVSARFVPHVVCRNVPDSLPDGWAMGPNEVNYNWPGMTCPMTPTEAATIMRALNAKFPDVRWVGPSVSACHPHLDPRCIQDGIEWMAEYTAWCPDCQAALAVHWYCTDGRDLAEYLNAMASFGYPLWLTEWGCDDLAIAKRSLEIINLKTSRHAWFALRAGQALVDQNGNLTKFGEWYSGR